MSQTIAVDISDIDSDRLRSLARQTGRNEEELISEAIVAYLSNQEWQAEAISVALRGSENGEPAAAHAQVAEWLRSWGTDRELPRPL